MLAVKCMWKKNHVFFPRKNQPHFFGVSPFFRGKVAFLLDILKTHTLYEWKLTLFCWGQLFWQKIFCSNYLLTIQHNESNEHNDDNNNNTNENNEHNDDDDHNNEQPKQRQRQRQQEGEEEVRTVASQFTRSRKGDGARSSSVVRRAKCYEHLLSDL